MFGPNFDPSDLWRNGPKWSDGPGNRYMYDPVFSISESILFSEFLQKYCLVYYQLRVQDFSLGGGGAPSRWRGADLRRRCFSVKTYVKTKELDPVGGRVPGTPPLDPPMIIISWKARKMVHLVLFVQNSSGQLIRPIWKTFFFFQSLTDKLKTNISAYNYSWSYKCADGRIGNDFTLWSQHFTQMENIEQFLRACRNYGMKEVDVFQTQDLYEAKAIYSVSIPMQSYDWPHSVLNSKYGHSHLFRNQLEISEFWLKFCKNSKSPFLFVVYFCHFR